MSWDPCDPGSRLGDFAVTSHRFWILKFSFCRRTLRILDPDFRLRHISDLSLTLTLIWVRLRNECHNEIMRPKGTIKHASHSHSYNIFGWLNRWAYILAIKTIRDFCLWCMQRRAEAGLSWFIRRGNIDPWYCVCRRALAARTVLYISVYTNMENAVQVLMMAHFRAKNEKKTQIGPKIRTNARSRHGATS